jgi:hypothetical protein
VRAAAGGALADAAAVRPVPAGAEQDAARHTQHDGILCASAIATTRVGPSVVLQLPQGKYPTSQASIPATDPPQSDSFRSSEKKAGGEGVATEDVEVVVDVN